MTTAPGRTALDAVRREPLAAVALLTRLPVAPREQPGGSRSADRTGAAAFGLVGAGLGVLAAAPVLLVGSALPLLAAALGILAIAVASGVLHLDGLADTADALAAPDPAAAERARTDPRIGAAGAVAVVGVLLVDVAAAAGTIETAGVPVAALALVFAGSASRAAAVVLARLGSGPDGSGHDGVGPDVPGLDGAGFGAWFASRVRQWDVVVAVGSAGFAGVALAILGDAATAAAAGAGVVTGIGLSAAVIRARGGLDGDGLGAGIEIVFAAALVSVAVWSAAVSPAAGAAVP